MGVSLVHERFASATAISVLPAACMPRRTSAPLAPKNASPPAAYGSAHQSDHPSGSAAAAGPFAGPAAAAFVPSFCSAGLAAPPLAAASVAFSSPPRTNFSAKFGSLKSIPARQGHTRLSCRDSAPTRPPQPHHTRVPGLGRRQWEAIRLLRPSAHCYVAWQASRPLRRQRLVLLRRSRGLRRPRCSFAEPARSARLALSEPRTRPSYLRCPTA